MVPSFDFTICVPSLRMPPLASSRWMICTRWPACHRRQSSFFASGKYSFSALKRSSSDSISWPARYWTSGNSSTPTCSIGMTLCEVVLPNRSMYEPFFRNFVENVANGPNRMIRLPSMTRVSRCGTDIGGEPTEALPYAFARWRFTTSGFSVTRNEPPTGKAAKSRASGMPEACSRRNAPPPAPMKRNFVSTSCRSPDFRLTYDTRHVPSSLRLMSRTSLDSDSVNWGWLCR